MNRNRKNTGILLLSLAAVLMLVFGCSTDRSPVGPSSPAVEKAEPISPIPPVGSVIDAKTLGEHVRVLGTGWSHDGTLDGINCDSMGTSRFCSAGMVNSVVIPLVTVFIPAGANPQSVSISISAPVGCEASAVFGPHPYQFNSNVQIRWNLKALGLPAGFDFTTLVPMYVADDGNATLMPYQVSGDLKTLTVFTDHFSRYILGEWVE